MLRFIRTDLVESKRALKGSEQPRFVLPETHAVSGAPLTPPFPENTESVVLGMGCFWGAERLFWQLPGVYVTSVGYAGGITKWPTYDDVCSGRTNHSEVVQVVYDTDKLSLEDVLTEFWTNHDPTQAMRQGNDIGTQYRSCVYVQDEQQLASVTESKNKYQLKLLSAGVESKITTEIAVVKDYYLAEEEHQQYLFKFPRGYCAMRGTGVSYC